MSGLIKTTVFVLSVLVTIGACQSIQPSWPSKFGVLVNYHSREYEGKIFHINDSDNNMFALLYDQIVSIYYPSEKRRYIKSNQSDRYSCYNTDSGIGKNYPIILPNISNFELMGEDSGIEIWQLVNESNPLEFYQMHIRIKTGAPVCFLHMMRDTNGESDVIKRLDYSGYSTTVDSSDYEYHRIGCNPRSEQMEEWSANHKMDSTINMAYVEQVIPASKEWQESNIEKRFASYLVEYKKEYSPLEYLDRLHIFRKRLAVNEGHNHRANEIQRLGINKFSDMREDEINEILGLSPSIIQKEEMSDLVEHIATLILGSIPESINGVEKNVVTRVKEKGSLRLSEIPDSIDWVKRKVVTRVKEKGSLRLNGLPDSIDWVKRKVVTRVRDQKKCDCCWAIATIGAVESAYAIATGKLKELSPQQLVDCVKKNFGCNGGNPLHAYRYLETQGGVISEKKYPYKAKEGTCEASKFAPSAKVKVSGFHVVRGGEAEVMEAVATKGPVSFCMTMGNLPQFDGKSVYLGKDCVGIRQHCALIVGYGTTPKDEGEIPYWLIKNSWGKQWGDKGYFKMIRNNNDTVEGPCNMYKAVMYPEVNSEYGRRCPVRK